RGRGHRAAAAVVVDGAGLGGGGLGWGGRGGPVLEQPQAGAEGDDGDGGYGRVPRPAGQAEPSAHDGRTSSWSGPRTPRRAARGVGPGGGGDMRYRRTGSGGCPSDPVASRPAMQEPGTARGGDGEGRHTGRGPHGVGAQSATDP